MQNKSSNENSVQFFERCENNLFVRIENEEEHKTNHINDNQSVELTEMIIL